MVKKPNKLLQKLIAFGEKIPVVKQFLKRKKTRRRLEIVAVVFIVVIAIFSYLTNPFVKFSIVFDPYSEIGFENNQYTMNFESNLVLKDNAFGYQLAWLKAGWHIINSRFTGGKKTPRTTVDEIIHEIHQIRFDPTKPYLISGDHFSILYPRSLGIFYHSILDSRTALDTQDWQNRQLIYLKTVAYALDVYVQSDFTSTTIVPIGPKSVALINIYALPSDTIYSMLYALERTQGDQQLRQVYPFEVELGFETPFATKQASKQLVEKYKDDLKRLIENYYNYAYDSESGLIRKDIFLSGAKDIMKRQSAFYDNVMLWKTSQLAQSLGILEKDETFLSEYKERIIDSFWYEPGGYFLEDLSEKSINEKWYSSDWLIAFQIGFLDAADPQERVYLEKSVSYIQRNALDQPFGLQFHADKRPERLYGVVNWVASEYGSTAIWSNWGMEYIKLTLVLAQQTGKEEYLLKAKEQLDKYAYNIKRYRGYPEVYDEQGDFYKTFLHKSVRRTGWVVSYEEARAMYEWTDENWQQFAR